jgi:hypothetical protein
VFSNGCLTGQGNSLRVDGDTGINYAGATDITHVDRFNPQPEPATAIDRSQFILPPPDCSGNTSYPAFETTGNQPLWQIPAGNYPGITVKHNATLVAGGLYCLSGNFNIEGSGSLSIDTSNGKSGVTIYMISGGFSTAGSTRVNLSAPPEQPDPSPAIPGVLIYMAEGNANTVILTGSSGSDYTGIVLAPDGTIKAGGNTSGIGYHTAFIGNNVEVIGGADLNFLYYESYLFGPPTSIELNK